MHATRAYGAARPTKDTDCLVKTEKESLRRLAAALEELHARLRVTGLSDEESAALPIHTPAILEQFVISNWRTDAGDLDVLTCLPARDGRPRRYGDLEASAVPLSYAGIVIRVASLEAIVESKEAAGREKDRKALPELHDLQRRRHPGGPKY